MKESLLLLVLSLFTGTVVAQRGVSNVRTRAINKEQIEITYTLDTIQPGDSIYFRVESRFGGVLSVKKELVSGDIGTDVVPGPNKKIIWRTAENGYTLNGEIRATVFIKPAGYVGPIFPQTDNAIAIKATDSISIQKKSYQTPQDSSIVVSTSSADSTKDHKRRTLSYSPGPGWALVSAVLPGVGNIFVQTNSSGKAVPRIGFRPLVTVGFYGLLLYGFQQRNQVKAPYDLYLQQKNVAEGEPFYEEANRLHHRYYLATRAAAAIWATDVALTLIRGIKNSRMKAKAKTVSFAPGLFAGQVVAVCTIQL